MSSEDARARWTTSAYVPGAFVILAMLGVGILPALRTIAADPMILLRDE